MKAVNKADQEYAAKFGVILSVEKYGIYGDEFDWVASPMKPHFYPNAGIARMPASNSESARSVVRIIAERIGTGTADFYGFHRTSRPL